MGWTGPESLEVRAGSVGAELLCGWDELGMRKME
jgi:hypothetical protein